MTEHSNGRDTQGGTVVRGRIPPTHPTTVLPNSGYQVTVRRLNAGTVALLNAQAYQELDGERPTPPKQLVEVGPGERPGDPPQTRLVEHAGDPDFQKALTAWGARVNQRAGEKFAALVQDYALITPTDDEAVSDYRAAMAALGIDTSHTPDRAIFVWEIVAPTTEDQVALFAFVRGLSEAQREAIAAAKGIFRRDVAGPPAGTVDNTSGEGQL